MGPDLVLRDPGAAMRDLAAGSGDIDVDGARAPDAGPPPAGAAAQGADAGRVNRSDDLGQAAAPDVARCADLTHGSAAAGVGHQSPVDGARQGRTCREPPGPWIR